MVNEINLPRIGTFLGRARSPGISHPLVVTVRGGDVVDITSKHAPTVRDICEMDDPAGYVSSARGEAVGSVEAIAANSFETGRVAAKPLLLSPIDLQAVKAAGIPVVPGSDGAVSTEEEALAAAREIGFPVLIKAAAGGGGRGMKVARSEDDLLEAVQTAQAEAKAAFGDDSVYLERYLSTPRHIELQVIADSFGNVCHLGERDCSLQRRHQKVLEEAPSPVIDAAARAKIGKVVVDAVRAIGYLGVGTIEFLYENGEFFFIEMNTRLQVEHPVTEAITDIDLVREQIRIAAGEKLSFTQEEVIFEGHAIECRINAENPRTFAPSPGLVTDFHAPGGLGVRLDSAIYAGYSIPPFYDSLIGKLIVHGRDRTECIARLKRCLAEMVVGGIDTTVPLFQELLQQPDIVAGDYNIHWLERWMAANG